MLRLVLIALICHMAFASGECNIDSKSLKDDAARICDAKTIDILEVSHAGSCGDTVSQAETEKPPTIRWNNADPDKSYTIVMVDPDAPPKEAGKYWVHLIMDAVQGNILATNGKIEGKIVEGFDYRPPTPPPHSGTHRYQIFVFESPEQDVTSSQTSRGSFSLEKFVSENNICKLAAQFQYQVNSPS